MRRWRGRRCVRRRCGGRRRLAIKADRLVECPKRLEDRRGARLAAHRGWAVDAIADKLAGVRLVAVAPKVRRVDAVRAAAEAVVFLQLIAEQLDGPRLDLVEPVDRERILGRLRPRERWLSGRPRCADTWLLCLHLVSNTFGQHLCNRRHQQAQHQLRS